MCVVRQYLKRISCIVFFFQAEDGIRDLVRSRGLGDVYKRQMQNNEAVLLIKNGDDNRDHGERVSPGRVWITCKPVSYTHLTLPTSDLV